jgi:hypothetical protein
MRNGLLALGLLAASANSASAQLLFDGNVYWNVHPSNTAASSFVGSTAAAQCGGALTTLQLITNYGQNSLVDPLLTGGIYPNNNFQPLPGSPAFTGLTVIAPDAGKPGFLDQTCYNGAVGPNPSDRWFEGWTYFDSTGAGRSDLHLGAPYDDDPRPIAVYDNVAVRGTSFWGCDSSYLVRGQLRVKNGASLHIAPGTVVFEEQATLGTIIVERGGKIFAVGTVCDPIIITSDALPGFFARGQCGGIVINGYGKTNLVNSCAGDSASSEGGAVGFYGGNDDDDNSGALQYVRVEYAGKEITANNELNSFTFNAIGKGTWIRYIQAHRGADDGIEFFGGANNNKYLIATDGTDDGYDIQMGSRTVSQYVIVRVSPQFAPSGTQSGDKGIEADNNEFGFDQVQCSGRSSTTIANMTIIGDTRSGASFPGSSQGAHWRRGVSFGVVNSIVTNFKSGALRVEHDPTWIAHCLAPPADPGPGCAPLGIGPAGDAGQVFVARSTPNPFRNQVNFAIELARESDVSVEIYGADGRLVDTLRNGRMSPGQHTVSWSVGRDMPSGMYFYKLVAGENRATGKIARIN